MMTVDYTPTGDDIWELVRIGALSVAEQADDDLDEVELKEMFRRFISSLKAQ